MYDMKHHRRCTKVIVRQTPASQSSRVFGQCGGPSPAVACLGASLTAMMLHATRYFHHCPHFPSADGLALISLEYYQAGSTDTYRMIVSSQAPRRPLPSSYGSTSSILPSNAHSHLHSHSHSPSHSHINQHQHPGVTIEDQRPGIARQGSFDFSHPTSTSHEITSSAIPKQPQQAHQQHPHTRHGGQRGMTFEEIQRGGILSADERSGDFELARLGVELDEKSIGKMPKKV